MKFSDNPDHWAPERRIRIVGGSGAQISILQNTSVDWRDVMIVGLLVDPQDLFASGLSSEFTDPVQAEGELLSSMEVESPRPARIAVEGSEDLESWKKLDASKVSSTLDPSVYQVRQDVDESKQQFLRARVKARPSQD